MGYEQATTEEINLVGLLRRLEKTAENEDEWRVREGVPVGEVVLRVRKTGQTVKFARGLIKTVEVECEDTPARAKRLNDAKMQLDSMDKFLHDLGATLEAKLEPVERVSLLSTLPLPAATRTRDEPEPEPEQLSIIPADAAVEMPALIQGSETARSSGTALHDELAVQLEQMARQLKRNAEHFSTALAGDRAVVEDAGAKMERNLGVLSGQRVRLRDRRGTGTWLVVGVVVVVSGVFLMVVMVLRIV